MTLLIASILATAVLVWWPASPRHRLGLVHAGVPRPDTPFGPKARARAAAKRVAALDVVGAFAAECAAGVPPTRALVAAAGSADRSVCPIAVMAARNGGDVAAALEQDAVHQQLPLLRSLAACWRVGERSGAGLVDALDQLLRSARNVEEINVQLEAQLAAPRATARMLATLPLIGIAMGMLMGANPLAWLLGTGPGLLCLTAGLGLTVLGWAWTGRIARGVTRQL